MPMAQSLFMWTQYCTFDDATYDLIVWCESNDCTWQNLFQNLLKTVFQVMTAANDLAAIAQQTKPNSQDYTGIEQYY